MSKKRARFNVGDRVRYNLAGTWDRGVVVAVLRRSWWGDRLLVRDLVATTFAIDRGENQVAWLETI